VVEFTNHQETYMIARDRGTRGWVAVMVAGMLGAPAGLAGQRPATPPRPAQPPQGEARECRCVDAQGRTQDDCFCFSMPRVAIEGFGGAPRRVVLGVNVRQDQPARYDAQGARLYGVDPESAAGKAGLEEGDVLARVDGTNLTEPLADKRAEDRLEQDASLPVQRLLAVLAEHEPGDTLRVEYLRDGARKNTSVVLGRGTGVRAFAMGPGGSFDFGRVSPGSTGMLQVFGGEGCPTHGDGRDRARARPMPVGFGRSCVAGVELLDMQPALGEYFGAREGGVLISDADADNPLGLRAGDVLLSVDGRDVRTVDRAVRALRGDDRQDSIALKVLRKERTIELKGKLK
jgi:hypothetical protein